MALTRDTLKNIIGASLKAQLSEQVIGCDECLEMVDQFAEHILDGKEIPEALRLVQLHLEGCPPCKDEFEALLTALREMDGSQ
ncbi:zf-HC2 domain-containing protein [Candidatus Acetothermia bacterium]|nr:zf-HC2 domain-containing protein [Candidatus Acetothermia bacterium]MBI3459380.1 zf-HC2 domain-containing protein [Candidatus Acetothermia bacterium]